MPFDVIVFDFDGTLVQSAKAKREAFFRVFPADFAPAVAAVLDRDPDGSRYRVIPEMIAEAARRGLPDRSAETETLIAAYGDAAAAAVDAAPEMPGANQVLRRLSGRVPLYLVSVTPHRQLLGSLAGRDWLGLFTGVYGYPHDKTRSVAGILAHHGTRPSRLLVVGDGESDARAAARNGCPHHRIGTPRDLATIPGLDRFQHV